MYTEIVTISHPKLPKNLVILTLSAAEGEGPMHVLAAPENPGLPENSASSGSRPVPLLESASSRLCEGVSPTMHYRQSSKRRAFC